MLPHLLLLLKDKPVVNDCGHDMSGADYRSQVIKSLCNAEWKPDSITMIAAMFRYTKLDILKYTKSTTCFVNRELPLAGEEFKQVVDKLLFGMQELDASEVPPFIYQMLRLCGHQYFLLVLMHAQKYFKNSAATNGAVNPDADSIETVISERNLTLCFHFNFLTWID